MQMIIAIIKPHKLDDVKNALDAIGVQGMTVTEVKGFGRQKGHKEYYRGAEYEVKFVPKVKIEVAVPEERLAETMDTIAKSANTGQIGDGKIFVLGIKETVRIRTGEKGKEAL